MCTRKIKTDVGDEFVTQLQEALHQMSLGDIQNKFPDMYNEIGVNLLSNLTKELKELNVGTETYCDMIDRISDMIALLNEGELDD